MFVIKLFITHTGKRLILFCDIYPFVNKHKQLPFVVWYAVLGMLQVPAYFEEIWLNLAANMKRLNVR